MNKENTKILTMGALQNVKPNWERRESQNPPKMCYPQICHSYLQKCHSRLQNHKMSFWSAELQKCHHGLKNVGPMTWTGSLT